MVNLNHILIFFIIASFVGAFCVGEAVRSFIKREYFIGGLSVMATFWVMLLISFTMYKVF